MNFDDEHELLVDLKKRFGGTMADQISDQEIAAQMLTLDPTARAEVLLKTDQYLASPASGTSLRKQAQLMEFNRNLRNLDYSMRKANR